MIKMDNLTAVEIAEGEIEVTEKELKEAWSLQGRFGRIAQSMIEDGFINSPNYDIDTIG